MVIAATGTDSAVGKYSHVSPLSGQRMGEVQLLSEHNQGIWGLIRKKAINYLTLSGAREAAELLSGLPFQYWAGTNSFGDEFDLLYLSMSVTQYLKLKLDAETKENKYRFSLIADAIQETGNYVRFIAADMEEGESDAV